MPVPHQFPSLIEANCQTILIAGSGLSAPNCPTVQDLRDKMVEIATTLGVTLCDSFYELADSVLTHLETNGQSASSSRLRLATELGLLDDRRWFGEVGLPLSGNTPRHRALARFAVEERIRAIISLNWDALIEVALDSVGLREGGGIGRPWRITEYVRVIDSKHLPLLAHPNVVPIIKPHGCVRELEQIRDQIRNGQTPNPVVFKLTDTELNAIDPTQVNIVNNHVKTYISECPLMGIGWRASEGYLREAIIEVAEQVQRPELDSLSMINLAWEQTHTDIAGAYERTEAESFIKVDATGNLTTDCLMLWLQGRHALVRMIAIAGEAERPYLEHLLQELSEPECGNPMLTWVDCWLPTWVRLCWRIGAMQGVDPQTNRPVGPFDIPITPRDVHVPLAGMCVDRRDLRAAGKLLTKISTSIERFAYDRYPGGLLDYRRNRLYLPLPGWRAAVPQGDLGALKPVVEAASGLGYLSEIKLVWLSDGDDGEVDLSLRRQLEAQVRRLMPLAGHASVNRVSWSDLDELMEPNE